MRILPLAFLKNFSIVPPFEKYRIICGIFYANATARRGKLPENRFEDG
jgi:hypothetical protein